MDSTHAAFVAKELSLSKPSLLLKIQQFLNQSPLLQRHGQPVWNVSLKSTHWSAPNVKLTCALYLLLQIPGRLTKLWIVLASQVQSRLRKLLPLRNLTNSTRRSISHTMNSNYPLLTGIREIYLNFRIFSKISACHSQILLKTKNLNKFYYFWLLLGLTSLPNIPLFLTD